MHKHSRVATAPSTSVASNKKLTQTCKSDEVRRRRELVSTLYRDRVRQSGLKTGNLLSVESRRQSACAGRNVVKMYSSMFSRHASHAVIDVIVTPLSTMGYASVASVFR